MNDYCCACGKYVPEGRQICAECEEKMKTIVVQEKPEKWHFNAWVIVWPFILLGMLAVAMSPIALFFWLFSLAR